MADENTRIVLECYAAFKAGEIERLLSMVGDDVDWESAYGAGDRIPIGGRRHGKADVRRFFRQVEDNLDFSRFDVGTTISQGEYVVVLGHYEGTVKPTGRHFSTDWSMLFQVRNGQIIWHREYTDTASVLESFGAGLTAGTARETRQPAARPS